MHQRKSAFPDAPSDQCNGLAHLDLDGFRFRLHGFREMHLEHAILEVGHAPLSPDQDVPRDKDSTANTPQAGVAFLFFFHP